jgi:hypothetical protein
VTVPGYKDREGGEDRPVIILGDVAGRRLRRTVEEFREPEEWFFPLVCYTSDITLLFNADGSLRYVSPLMKRVMGSKPGMLVRTPDPRRYTPRRLRG